MRYRTWGALFVTAAAVPIAAAPAANLAASAVRFATVDDTENKGAAIDYGFGAGVKPGSSLGSKLKPDVALNAPAGNSLAGTQGTFGATLPWPIIPIHEVLLPDGRVMSFGSNQDGSQSGQFVYDVWNPALGTGTSSHNVLPNTTNTDIFCSGQAMMWTTGQALMTGGDLTVNGVRNYSNNATTIFNPANNTIGKAATMAYPRWYDSIVPLPDEEMLVLGGRTNPTTPALTPEVYSPWNGWKTLTGANSNGAFGDSTYPRGFGTPDGRVYVAATSGQQFYFTTSGTGTVTQAPGTIPGSDTTLPTMMFAPGKLLSLRSGSQAGVIDISGANPVYTATSNIDQYRSWSSGTVLADGKVMVNGGSSTTNSLTGAVYRTTTWDPATGQWTLGATTTHPRLYHSNALLMPDGSVLTGGGGAPGPVINLNSEIYYPPYLYAKDGSGNLAARPRLDWAPGQITWGQPLYLQAGQGNVISRVTFVRMGSTTHAMDFDQRFVDLPFTQNGISVAATLPTNWNVLLPGNWMAFLWQNGVPSIAKVVLVPS